MEQTLNTFRQQQLHAASLLRKLEAFLAQGRETGVAIDPSLSAKLQHAIGSVEGDRLKVVLIGGFSEGKTSIAAAWMERLDRSTMKISHHESSNEVKVYETGDDLVLIDTPGLFGFKEQFNAEGNALEKYKDITRKYVSEAHLVLYVMNSTNPIKESHQDDLQWLFRTLGLLPRTVFVLSRFDEVADVEDAQDYRGHLDIKRGNVQKRLADLIALTPDEAAQLAIVGVAANPFDMGTDHWLAHPEQFRSLSHVATLQKATLDKIAATGGPAAIIAEAKKSVIRDVLGKQMPVAIENDERIAREVAKLDAINIRMQGQLASAGRQIGETRVSLREFVTDYFTDLILQARGVDMETFGEFFERQVGDGGIVMATRLQNEFDRQLGAVNLQVSQLTVGFESDVNHFNATVRQYGKQGVDFLVKSKAVNNASVLAARDGVVATAKLVGVDLGKLLKFKPWGAAKFARGVNGALVVVGLAFEVWDSIEQMKRQEAFRATIKEITRNFEDQREELLALLNSENFVPDFCADYVALEARVDDMRRTVIEGQASRERFQAWRRAGEAITVEFASIPD